MERAPQSAPIPLETVAGARQGDRAAIAEIYRALAPGIIGYLRGAGAHDPEDLAGDVFVGVMRGLPSFVGDGAALRTWAFTIAHRRLVDARRRLRRRPELPLDETDNVLLFAAGDDFEGVLGAITAVPVRRALGSLTSDQRAVVLLRVVGGLSLAETAATMHKPVAAVKMLQRRGLDALARTIREKVVT
jgi:RNA polymerase sigma-70 factor (ECF subfamily)